MSNRFPWPPVLLQDQVWGSEPQDASPVLTLPVTGCPPALRREVSRGWSRWWERQQERLGAEEASRGGEHRQKRGGQE